MKDFTKTFSYFVWTENSDIYVGKETFLPSGYGLPMTKGHLLQNSINKWQDLQIRGRLYMTSRAEGRGDCLISNKKYCLSTNKRDTGESGFKLIQNFVMPFMDDP